MESTQSPNPPTPPTPPRGALLYGGVAMIVLAGFLLLCGFCSSVFYLVIPLTSKESTGDVQSNVLFGSTAGLGILFGTLLLWQGLSTLLGRVPRPAARAFPPTLLFVLAFFLAIPLGMFTLGIAPLATYLFPPWHFLAASLPPLAFLAYAAHRLGTASGLRALVASFGWGALGAMGLAVMIELVIVLTLVVVAVLVFLLIPNSPALLEQWRNELEWAQEANDIASMARLVANPVIIAIALFYFAFLVPIIEEGVKTIVVAFIDPSRTRLADALLWGIGAGAGFAAVESVLNASVGLTIWAATALLRIGATIMHVSNGATMGRGWYAARVERRWGRLFLAYGVSVFFHALWNAAAIGFSGSLLYLGRPTLERLGTLTVPEAALLVAAVAVLIVLSLLGLVVLYRQLAAASRA